MKKLLLLSLFLSTNVWANDEATIKFEIIRQISPTIEQKLIVWNVDVNDKQKHTLKEEKDIPIASSIETDEDGKRIQIEELFKEEVIISFVPKITDGKNGNEMNLDYDVKINEVSINSIPAGEGLRVDFPKYKKIHVSDNIILKQGDIVQKHLKDVCNNNGCIQYTLKLQRK